MGLFGGGADDVDDNRRHQSIPRSGKNQPYSHNQFVSKNTAPSTLETPMMGQATGSMMGPTNPKAIPRGPAPSANVRNGKAKSGGGFCCFGGARAVKDDDDDEGVHAPAQLINNNYMPQQQQQPAYNTMPQQYEQEYEQVEQYQPEMAAQGGGATYPTPATPPKSRETSHVTGFSSPRQDGNSYANDVTPFGSSVTDVGSSARPPPDASRGSLVGEDFSTSAKSEQFKVMARRVFDHYDSDHDGYLTLDDLMQRYRALELDLPDATFRLYVQNNFTYADRDRDDRLSFNEYFVLHRLLSDVHLKFNRHDSNQDGFITKAEFTSIIMDLQMNMEPSMVRQYVEINFKFADRSLKGVVSFGQFLSTYSNFLLSHNIRGVQATSRQKEQTNKAQQKVAVHKQSGPRRVQNVEVSRQELSPRNPMKSNRENTRGMYKSAPGGVVEEEDMIDTQYL